MIGERLSHYRILEEIGSGGMGVVYLARDERLDRPVAVKVLPRAAPADASSRARFRQEALSLSRVNHPHIATVYDFDAQDGVDFLVLENVTGPTLKEKLASGPLPEREAVELAVQAAEGLAAAHDAGVIHRDIKPANLKLTPDGRLKILDFGLSTLCCPTTPSDETLPLEQSLGTAGTLHYMAPEQLLGREVDSRVDLYALGIVLYEMATGRHPFLETSPTAMVNAILHADAPAPRDVNPAICEELEAIIRRAMARRPEDRFATARDLASALRRLALRLDRGAETDITPAGAPGPAGPRRIESIAVLPLEDLSRSPEEDYFADGMTEALIAGLARIGSVRVISRTSVMQYKGKRVPLPEIARALHVDAIVEGSVLRSGNRIRITALLVDVASDRHLWAESYERDLGDILALQSEVARSIAAEIRIRLTPQEQAHLSVARAVDPEAYRLYLKGRYHWEKRTEEGLRRAHDLLRRAIDHDPAYAAAYSGVADVYVTFANFNMLAASDAFPKAKAAAMKALEIDPLLAEAHTSLAAIQGSHDWDRAGAEAGFKRAIELNPNYATAHHWYADHLISLARFDEGLAEIAKAAKLDPLSLIISSDIGGYLFYARRYEEALAQIHRTLELDATFAPALRQVGGISEQMGRYEEAIAAAERTLEITNGATSAMTSLAHAYAIGGRREDALRMLRELDDVAARRYVSPYGIAAIHAGLGDVERAFEWLERARRDRDRALIWLKVAPRFDRLRGDPRFTELLRAVGAA